MEPIWTPTAEILGSCRLTSFTRWLAEHRGLSFAASHEGYRALHAWSVTELDAFWGALWEFAGLGPAPAVVCADRQMPGASWCPDTQVNYVSVVARHTGDRVAVIDVAEPGGPPARRTTRDELLTQVASVAGWLRAQGVRPGDRVAGYLPNITEAVVAFLATASIGAIWSSCGQDYAAEAALSRLAPLEPSVLITCDGYRYGGKDHDRWAAIEQVRAGLPTVRATVVVERLVTSSGSARATQAADGLTLWGDLLRVEADLEISDVPFDHPLWVLFSSGTTGRPKGIVHSQGGVVLEHLKQMILHTDLGEDDTYFWYTSPSWMMWNFLVAGLLVGSTIVVYDGNPLSPTPDTLWRLAEELGVTVLGVSPAYLLACEKAQLNPGVEHDLSRLRVLGTTGSVLPSTSYHWVADHVGDIPIASVSGGTDVVSAFVAWAPTVPVWPGECSVICLGAAVDAWDPAGHPVRGEVGELVVTAPMPSMPIMFWDDPDGARYREAYFDTYPGTWRHGDWIMITDRETVSIHGRSDSTLNRGGIRMGSADIYRVVERFPEVAEALVIGAEQPDGGYWMPLFVQLAPGVDLTGDLIDRISTAIRTDVSPRHVPDEIQAVAGVPHTRTGKKLEVPVKRILQGVSAEELVDPQSVDDPSLLTAFEQIAAQRQGSDGA